jgi:DNA mismatch endonuclease (patch repair protein)
MKLTGQRDTLCEIRLRRELFRLGLRYRVNVRLEGYLVDIVFISARLAVFVDGCFWHSCRIHGTEPRRNEQWWRKKLEDNVKRDRRVSSRLKCRGWRVARFWEHEDPVSAARRVAALIRAS